MINDSQDNPNLTLLTDVLAKSHPNLNKAPDLPLESEINDDTYTVGKDLDYTYEGKVISDTQTNNKS